MIREIGDTKQLDFKPQVKFMKWNNEANFSVRGEEKVNSRVEAEGGKTKYICSEYEIHMYDKPDAAEEGGFEFEWILPTRPKSNRLTATLEYKNVDFFYQPELTEEEKRLGSSQPENTIGSYAVYHSYRKGGEYKTGKLAHIYRPKAIDAVGNESWCILNINKNSKKLTVDVPKEFLDSAEYPVVVDPTFGYTSVGALNSFKLDDVRGAEGTPSSDGTVDSITVYINSSWTSGEEQKCAIYDSSGNFIAETEELTTGGDGWITFNFASPPSVTSGSKYLIGVYQDDNIQYKYDNTSGLTSPNYSGVDTYPTWPDPVGTSTAFQFSIYANYSEGGGETFTPQISWWD